MIEPTFSHERNYGCRITQTIFRGLRTVTLENELIRVTVLADKGSDIIEFLHKPTDTDFMWRSPQGVRNPTTFVPTIPRPEGAFLDYYEGGGRSVCPPAEIPPTTEAQALVRMVRFASSLGIIQSLKIARNACQYICMCVPIERRFMFRKL